ncbi:glucose 1-dehydrogenase [Pseudonocardia sp. KRD-184]|uniref:Glucose 1-dehydrogenase n=1 Tax=Pseudonocardia oceani TaxID=2792013 RepID=A0ABS6UFC7_9PSEU|nr:glucose 1-dehydrogenase [Pseudonocardia oceani]MBW0088356.1 glucose 1-dehydrogenase [Pseudonocardia oceani]MBW0096583.1 glucose 1-dehydrogenase [Pseudonocardia oceani]MBW0109247.1 glucose 1-dehydrogenase [Pseudonocardia oceani]MBW0120318.1 glucose 1-dehydrogenase [Pseudonocardia oceani]MBW0130935.1 glucose 1-dehydrogenase [Pseudonocardia oceani]
MDFDLEGRVAIVTGASRGLGRAAAEALVAEGVRVLAVARSTGELEKLQATAPDRIAIATVDMRSAEEVAALADLAVERFGRLDVVVNNAGIAPAGRFVDQPQEQWDEVFDVNVRAPAVLSRAAGGHFLAQRSGKIINIASTSGINGKPVLVSYSASKGAVLQFTKALAAEWGRFGVQVTAIAPGAFETDAQSAVLDDTETLTRRLRKIPAGRMGRTEEFGPLVCYLASPLSDFMTGSVVVFDGGEVNKL